MYLGPYLGEETAPASCPPPCPQPRPCSWLPPPSAQSLHILGRGDRSGASK